ncbi:SRPBCC family protein [Pseudoroseicyclus sp. CXY001]|uniref:SRPBCC family protein n=1 Tax=Pseudoroseicyclus sp. CXY001 TaxID=3242492 RepID=UPI00358DC480
MAPMTDSPETTTERISDRELVVTRRLKGAARHVFAAWTRPELMQRWWVPPSFGMTFVSCEMDVRTGGTYRFTFAHPSFDEPMAFFGRYTEVVPDARIVWTNEEEGHGEQISTLTLKEEGGETLLTLHELYPSKEALDAALASGSTGAYPEQFVALDALLAEGAADPSRHSRPK